MAPNAVRPPPLVEQIGESPILSLIDRIFTLRERGVEILALHIGEPDFPTPLPIQEAAARAMREGATHYVPAAGMAALRVAIAEDLARTTGAPTAPEQVVVLTAKFALFAALLATLAPGDEILLPEPTYLFEAPARLVGARPVYVPLGPGYRLDPEALRDAITERTRGIVIATPANPTGHRLDRSEIGLLADLSNDFGLTVVSDETYRSLTYGAPHESLAAAADWGERLITVGSFSKTYAMTGWRAGYAVAAPPVRDRLVTIVEHTLTCLPPFVQEACRFALEHGAEHAERFRQEFARRRAATLAALARIPGVEFVPPDGAFYVFARLPGRPDSVRFAEELLSRERVSVVPGVAFGPSGEGCIRIAFTRPIPELEEGIRRLGHFLEGSAGPAR